MTTKTQEVHYCDYCNKHLFRKKAMQKHENICKFNPVNKPKCYGCIHFNIAEYENENNAKIRDVWECKSKNNIQLISIIAEKKGKFREQENTITMPHINAECEHYIQKPKYDCDHEVFPNF